VQRPYFDRETVEGVLEMAGQRCNGPRFVAAFGDEEGRHQVGGREAGLSDEPA
jgi:hypothetical protein